MNAARKFRIVRPLDVGALQAQNEKRRLDHEEAVRASVLGETRAKQSAAEAGERTALAREADVNATAARNAELHAAGMALLASTQAENARLGSLVADLGIRLDAQAKAHEAAREQDRAASAKAMADLGAIHRATAAESATAATVNAVALRDLAGQIAAARGPKKYRIDHGDGTSSEGMVTP